MIFVFYAALSHSILSCFCRLRRISLFRMRSYKVLIRRNSPYTMRVACAGISTLFSDSREHMLPLFYTAKPYKKAIYSTWKFVNRQLHRPKYTAFRRFFCLVTTAATAAVPAALDRSACLLIPDHAADCQCNSSRHDRQYYHCSHNNISLSSPSYLITVIPGVIQI